MRSLETHSPSPVIAMMRYVRAPDSLQILLPGSAFAAAQKRRREQAAAEAARLRARVGAWESEGGSVAGATPAAEGDRPGDLRK